MTEMRFLGTENSLWQDVFSKFATIVRMNPWKWFGERDVFAIHPDGYSEPFFVRPCHGRYACERGLVIVYGWNANALFYRLAAGGDALHSETRSHEMPIVLCALRKWGDLSQMEQLAAKTFAGVGDNPAGEVPAFVSFRPGWLPWHLSRVEVESTGKVLNQVLGVLLRAEDDISLIEQTVPGRIWVRRHVAETDKWEEGWTAIQPFVEFGTGRKIGLSDGDVEKLLALPQTMPAISIDFDVVPKLSLLNAKTVQLTGEDGRLPLGYLFAIQPFGVAADGAAAPPPETGVFYPASDIGSIPKFLLSILVKFLLKSKARPKEIVVSSERTRGILRPLQMRVPFKIVFHEKIPEYMKLLTLVRGAVQIKTQKVASVLEDALENGRETNGKGADGEEEEDDGNAGTGEN